jgi:transposase
MSQTRALDLALRDKAKALFLAGASIPQTAESLGIAESTVRAWVYRYKWATVKRSVKPLVQSLVTSETTRVAAGIERGLEQEGRELRKKLSLDLQGTAKRLGEQWASPDSIREELERSQVVRQVAAVASTLYGWDKESITSTVRIGAMGSLDDQGEGENAVIESPSE